MFPIVRSPLPYVGGKYFLVPTLLQCGIPSNRETIVTPFAGGAAIELNLALRGYPVRSYDLDRNVINFWEQFLANADSVMARAKEILKSHNRAEVKEVKAQADMGDTLLYPKMSALDNAAWCVVLTKLSWSGLLSKKSWIRDFYTGDDGVVYHKGNKKINWGRAVDFPEPIFFCDRVSDGKPLKRLSNADYASLDFEVRHGDFRDTLPLHTDNFLYCDPPYFGSEYLYSKSKSGFDHAALFGILNKRERWLLSYEDCPEARELYADYRYSKVQRRTGFNNADRKLTELLIASHDVSLPPVQGELPL